MDKLETFDRAAAAATKVVTDITDEQFGLPTPCTEWTVRNVLNHLVTGNLMTVAIVGGKSHPDRTVDRLGADPKAVFATSLEQARAALAQPGLMERVVTTPMGEAPGSVLADMRVAELVVHAWDLARATGQPTDIEPELAAVVRQKWETQLGDRPRAMTPFADPQPVSDDATAADRLAAYLGRTVVVA